MITKNSDHIKVKGHVGTWYVIDEGRFVWIEDTPTGGSRTVHTHCFLLEHETYGDEAACVIVDENGSILLEDVWNGFEDLEDVGWCEEKPRETP